MAMTIKPIPIRMNDDQIWKPVGSTIPSGTMYGVRSKERWHPLSHTSAQKRTFCRSRRLLLDKSNISMKRIPFSEGPRSVNILLS